MSECSCHISPPCGYCMDKYECIKCGEFKHPDESEEHQVNNEGSVCNECWEAKATVSADY